MALKKIKREKSTTTKGHYVTNAVLLPEVLEAKSKGYVTDKLAKMFLMIAERYSKKSNFVGYSFREDMVSVALINLCANGLKFDPKKSDNPFAFYTTMIHNSFLQYIADEKKHRNIRDELILEIGFNPSTSFTESAHDDYTREHNSDDFYHRAPTNIEIKKVGNPYEYGIRDAEEVAPNFNVEQKKRSVNNRRPFAKKKVVEVPAEIKEEVKTARKKKTDSKKEVKKSSDENTVNKKIKSKKTKNS